MKISTEIQSATKIIGEEKAVELIAKAGFDAWDFSLFSMCAYDWRTRSVHPSEHPLAGNKAIEFAKKLKKIGLDGIECYNSIHSPEDIEELLKIAEAHDMLITGGSDYHGPISTPNYELSKGKNNNISNMPTQIVSNLSSYKKNNINK